MIAMPETLELDAFQAAEAGSGFMAGTPIILSKGRPVDHDELRCGARSCEENMLRERVFTRRIRSLYKRSAPAGTRLKPLQLIRPAAA